MTEKTILHVIGMSCGHCVKTVEDSVGALSGINAVHVNLEEGTVEVQYDNNKIDVNTISETIENQGYDIAR